MLRLHLTWLMLVVVVMVSVLGQDVCDQDRPCAAQQVCALTRQGTRCLSHTDIPCQNDEVCTSHCYKPLGTGLGLCGACNTTNECSQGLDDEREYECRREQEHIYGSCEDITDLLCTSDAQCLGVEFCDRPPSHLPYLRTLGARGSFTRRCRARLARGRPCARHEECWSGACRTKGRGYLTVGRCQ